VRELLNEFGYPGDTLPFIQGSALCALKGTNPEIGEASIVNLLNALDNSFVIPDRNANTDPMFPAEHVYQIPGET
jgi:elongation factor Tu